MNYLPLPDEAARQAIDAQTILAELTHVKALARQYEGGMYWKQEDGYEYLIKTGRGNRQRRLSARSPELESTLGQSGGGHGQQQTLQVLLAAQLLERGADVALVVDQADSGRRRSCSG